MKIDTYYFSVAKQVFDRGLALVLMMVLWPVLLLIALVVWATSGAPVLFRQKRLGKDGREFLLLKFRTMKKNAPMLRRKYEHLNQAVAPMFKIHNDPRFVGAGRWLAHTGLDELPQLWNILKGEMSFVGPRALPVAEARALPAEWRAWREQVRPGIFSAWAREKNRHQSLTRWRALEAETLRSGSVFGDVREIFSTLWLMVRWAFGR